MDLPDKGSPPSPKKDIKPVVSGGVKKVQRPATRRFLDFMFAESPKALASKIGRETIVPRIKQGMEEAFNSFVHGMFWGKGESPLPNNIHQQIMRGGGVNYQAISSQTSALTQARVANQSRSHGNYEDLICPNQQIAEALLANMYNLLNQFNVVAVGDLYELAGMSSSISDGSYGWTNLDTARIRPTQGGFVLELPRPNLI